MDISVIVQFYNEEENIEFVLSEIVSVLRLLGRKFEIIAVDDGSTDKTSEILRNKRKDIEELIVKAHIKNLGKDACWWAGFEAANGDIVVNTDGDGQDEIVKIPSFSNSSVEIFKNSKKVNEFKVFNDIKIELSGALGDINNDGQEEIIIGVGKNGGPQVKIFNNKGNELASFFAFIPAPSWIASSCNASAVTGSLICSRAFISCS